MKPASKPPPPRRLRVHCPQCGVKLAVESEQLGRSVRCPGCANTIFLQPGKHPDLDATTDGDALKLQLVVRATLDETATPHVVCTFEDQPGEYSVGGSQNAASPPPASQVPPGASLTSEVVWQDKRQQPNEFRLSEPIAGAPSSQRPGTETDSALPAEPQRRLSYVASDDLLDDPYAKPASAVEKTPAVQHPDESAASPQKPAGNSTPPIGQIHVPLDATVEPDRTPAAAGYATSEPVARNRPLSQLPSQPPITDDPLAAEQRAAPESPDADRRAGDDAFNVLCPLCGTVIECQTAQIGQRVTCPDCRSQVAVRSQQKQTKVRPARAPSDAYAVGEERAVAAPAAARAQPPSQIPVVCRVCGTRMHAALKQVGQQINCPDCHTLSVVPAPQAEPQPAAPVEAAPYALGAAPVRPAPPPPPPPPPAEEEEEDAGESTESAQSMAAWWSVADLRAFAFKPEATQFLFMSSVLFGLAQFLFALGSWMAQAIPLLPEVIVRSPASLALLAAIAHASAALQAIVSSSGSGGDEVEQWPGFRPSEWMMPLLHVLFHAALAMALAGMFTALLGLCLPNAIRLILFVGFGSLVFSFTYMSSLEEDSLLTPWANETRRCVEKMPLSWLIVAGVATAGGAATVAVAQAVSLVSPLLAAWVSAPIIPLTLVLYGRSLGRLIWSYAEHKRKRKKKRKPFRPPPPPDPSTDPFLNP